MDLDLTSRNSGGLTKKRTRILLSCAPCRNSKLKCDREQPCGQCAKKGRLDLCVYAPKPEKKRPAAKGMAARLKRLEGMVRGMMDEEGNIKRQPQAAGESAAPQLKGQVVHGENATTYVGATHCLAMLEDVSDESLRWAWTSGEKTARLIMWCRLRISRPTLMIPEIRTTMPCRGMSWTGRRCFSTQEELRVIEKIFSPSCPKERSRTGSSRGISHPRAHLSVSTAISTPIDRRAHEAFIGPYRN